jgi:hypothetical protein
LSAIPCASPKFCPSLIFNRIQSCFFIIGHGRGRIVNFNVTSHPTAGWIMQQLREASPYQSAPRFLIFDRDAKFRGPDRGTVNGHPAGSQVVPKVPGKTELLSAGSSVAGGTC